MMRDRQIKSVPRDKLVYLNEIVHSFRIGNRSNSEIEKMYMMLDDVTARHRLREKDGKETVLNRSALLAASESVSNRTIFRTLLSLKTPSCSLFLSLSLSEKKHRVERS
ncbi:hypothetical protein OPV22_009584 [Ensete ventricosum]|uniref:Uncharacterized protein n=1 Tax=Ensete ventricosum TaxID=4639 RepID=A0AAV8RET7_ENSVE|nr:hypothetical protein OPV22_009584 [Ensete ventricosum]